MNSCVSKSLLRFPFFKIIYSILFQFSSLKGDKHEVTALAKSPDKAHIAVGYNDGMIKVFDVASGDVMVNFSGHKSTVTALKYDHQGIRLVSGAKVHV